MLENNCIFEVVHFVSIYQIPNVHVNNMATLAS